MTESPQKHILLINPPIEDFYQTHIRQEPLGLAYLAAVLEQAQFKVTVLNALAQNQKQKIQLPPELDYLRVFYPLNDVSPFRLFTYYYHFGLSFNELTERIKTFSPDLIGITANFTPYFSATVQVARICKIIHPSVPVVVGGHHVTVTPEMTLTNNCFDFVVLGEGEATFLELIRLVFKNSREKLAALTGIGFRDNGRVRINWPTRHIQPLDQLPFPKKYTPDTAKMILTSRGCPNNCHFCTIRKVMGQTIRYRSLVNVLQEIEYWINQGIGEFDFEDDNLLYNPLRAKQLWQSIIIQFGKRQLKLSAMNGIAADTLDEELLELMYLAGFEWLNVPLVSGNPNMLKRLARNQSSEYFFQIVQLAAKYQLKVVAYLIVGLPQDTIEKMIEDIISLARLKVLIGPSIFYPPPGSPVYEYCLQRNYIQSNTFSLFRSSAVPVETENFSRTDIVTLFRIIRLLNFIKQLIDTECIPSSGFYQWLKDEAGNTLIAPKRLSREQIGCILLREFFLNQQLKGLRLREKKGNQFYYQKIEYITSEKVIQKTLNSLTGTPIRGVSSEREVILA